MDRFLALRIFNAVVEEESLIGASRKLALSPSAVSKNLAALEEELGARLLNRTTRRVSLTEAGEAYYERTARLLADLDEADGMVSRMEGAPRGVLRVSAPISFGQRHLAPALPDFRAQHPEVVVQMFLEDRVVDLVAERFDLAIRIANLRDSSLVARKLASNHRKIYAAPDYIARHGLPVTPSDIEQHALVTMPPGSPLLDLTLTRGDEVRSLHLLGDIQLNSVEGVLAACLAGGGLAVLPSYMVCDHLIAGRLVPVLPDYTVPDTVIQAVFPSSRHLSIKVRAFIDFMVARFSPMPPWECVDRMPAAAPRAELVEAD